MASSEPAIGAREMKIYFAGSIRGGRDDLALYQSMIAHLQTKGTVLTEHIGKPSLQSMGEEGVTEEYIYQRDKDWLLECDVVVAECTQPSLGVGYELGFAEAHRKQVFCLFRPSSGRSLSAMIQGNSAFTVHEYDGLEGATAAIDAYLEKMKSGFKAATAEAQLPEA